MQKWIVIMLALFLAGCAGSDDTTTFDETAAADGEDPTQDAEGGDAGAPEGNQTLVPEEDDDCQDAFPNASSLAINEYTIIIDGSNVMVWSDSNGVDGIQTDATCPGNPDTQIA